jgi:hypothetical protein
MQASRLITVMTEKVFAVGKVNIGGCRGFYLWFLSSLDWLKFFGFLLAKPTPLLNVGSIIF